MRSVLAWLLALTSAACGAQALDDFAYAAELSVSTPAPFYSVTLPRPVYEGAASGDLRDVRVFNGAGEVVPHAWRPRQATVQPPALSAPLFALRGRQGSGVESRSVRVETRSDGTIVSVAPAPRPASGDDELHGYLADVSLIKVALRGVEIERPAGAAPFVGKLTLEASDDLATWRVLARETPVLSLTSGAGQLQRLRVEFAPQKLKYLRLSWPAGTAPIEIAAIKVLPGEARAEPQREWKALSATRRREHEFVLDPGGRFPADRLRMRFPQANTVAEVEVLSRAPGTIESWAPLRRVVAYRLQAGDGEVANPDIELEASPRDALLVRVDAKSGGIGEGTPGFEIGWIPHELVFAARGAGPFRLAYGNASAGAAVYPIESLVPGYQSKPDPTAPAPLGILPARAGEPMTLAGPAALRKPIDAKRWILWSALVVGVLVLGAMAWWLLREVGGAQPGAADTDPARRVGPTDRSSTG
jgi:hypothetical protein